MHILIGRLIKIIISSLAARYSETADGAVWQLPLYFDCVVVPEYIYSRVSQKRSKASEKQKLYNN